MILVVRRENGHQPLCAPWHRQLPRAHRAPVTDFGLFTCDDAIGEDVNKVFRELTSLGRVPKLNKLLQSPFTLHAELLAQIARETLSTRVPASRPASWRK